MAPVFELYIHFQSRGELLTSHGSSASYKNQNDGRDLSRAETESGIRARVPVKLSVRRKRRIRMKVRMKFRVRARQTLRVAIRVGGSLLEPIRVRTAVDFQRAWDKKVLYSGLVAVCRGLCGVWSLHACCCGLEPWNPKTATVNHSPGKPSTHRPLSPLIFARNPESVSRHEQRPP